MVQLSADQHVEPEIYFYKFLPENKIFAEMGDEVESAAL